MPLIATRNRRSALITALAAVAVLLVVAAGAWLWLSQRDGAPDALGTRTVKAGQIEVTITALTLDDTGARFRIAFDTHTVDLDTPLPAAAQLRVNGEPVSAGEWNGDKPGGHHREGILSFDPNIPSGASVELRITGLPEPVTATWNAP